MCQAISDGGRRCPVHRRDSMVAMYVARQASGLPADMVADLFNELRKTGRHAAGLEMTEENYNTFVQNLQTRLDEVDADDTRRQMFEDRTSDEAPKPDTLYALRRVHGAAVSRAASLSREMRRISQNLGITEVEAKERFDALRAQVDTSRNAEVPAEFTRAAFRAAYDADLPTDRASVVALARLRAGQETEAEAPLRVNHVSLQRSGSAFVSGGYDPDGGRLEVVFRTNPDRIYAYRNVPESVWTQIESGDSPMQAFADEIRGNREYAYGSQEEADADARQVRCSLCGQFRAASHTCPERQAAEAVAARNPEANSTQVQEIVEESEAVAADDVVVGDTPAETETVDTTSTVVEDVPVPSPAAEEVETSQDESAEAEATSEAEATDESADDASESRVVVTEINGLPFVSLNSHVQPSDYIPTVEAQNTPPAPVERPVEWQQTLSSRGYGTEVTTVASQSNSYYVNSMSEEDQELVRNGQPGQRFIIHRTEYAAPYKVIGAYDSTDLTFSSEWVYNEEEGRNDKVINLSRRGYIDPSSFTAEERSLRPAAYAQTPDGQLERVQCESLANATSRYNPQGGSAAESDRIRWAKVRDFRNAINDGKVAAAHIEWEGSRYRGTVDAYGYDMPRESFSVVGTLAVQRNADGTFRTVSGAHELRCNCAAYRRNYHCPHVDYVRNHGVNVAQQMMTPNSTAPALPADNPHNLPVSLLRRDDYRVVTDDEGNTVHQFTGGYRSYRRRSAAGSITSEDVQASQTSPEQAMALYSLANSTLYAPPAGVVRTAVRQGDVDVPVRVDSGYYAAGGYGTVTGTVRLHREDDGTITASSERLRCACGRFRSADQPCTHVRVFREQAARVLASAGAREDEYDVQRRVRDLREMHDAEVWAQEWSATHEGVTIEESRQIAADRVERERLAREQREREYREQREREQREYEERMRDRVGYERRRFSESNPEFETNLAAYRQDQAERWSNVEAGYAEDLSSLRSDIEAVQAAREAGREVLEFKTENVTDGICDPSVPGSRRFGVELEFDISSSVNRSEALRKIGRELHEAGLTDSPSQVGYHSAARSGYSKWSFEQDCTVSGELVSPIMSDSPEDWEQLQKACEILKRNGAIATVRAGSHVHVSTSSYKDSVAKHAEVLRTVKENEDILYRAAADPSRGGQHRLSEWCRPNVEVGGGDMDADRSMYAERVLDSYQHSSHNVAVNLGAATELSTKANIEFRMWDSSLNPATIQQQIVTSVALAEHADRTVERNGRSTARSEDANRTLGHHAAEGDDLTDNGTLQHVASFAHSMFRRQEDRKRFVSLFAANKWQETGRRRRR